MLETVAYNLFCVFIIGVSIFGLIAVACFSLMGIEIVKEILKDWGWF